MPAATSKRRSASTSKSSAGTDRKSKLLPITPEDLTRFVYVGDPQISPDGEVIVFTRKNVGEKNDSITNLWITSTGKSAKPRQFTSGGKDSHPRFSPDGGTIAFIGGRTKAKPQVFTMPVAGGEAVALTRFPEGAISSFKWSPDGKFIAVSFRETAEAWTVAGRKAAEEKGLSEPPRVLDNSWYRLDGDGYFDAQRHHLYMVDVETGDHRKIFDQDALGHFAFDISPDSSQIVVATNRDPRALHNAWNDEMLLIDVRTGKARAVPHMPHGPKAEPCFSPDGKWIAFAGREGDEGTYSTENLELFLADVRKGGARSLTGETDHCLMARTISDSAEAAFNAKIEWSPDSTGVYTRLGWHGEMHLAFIPLKGGIKVLTSGEVDHNVGNVSRNGKRFALTAATDTRLGEVYVGEMGFGGRVSTRRLTDFNGPLLAERAVAPIESHWVNSTNGTKVQVWVMKPPGFSGGKNGKKIPAILEIHGGPHAMYGVGFFHEFQVLAAQGYAVFFSNPRGSKGYGRDFCAAIRGAWGTADWEDVQAVTAFMKSQSWVNAKRMGVMGGSYGGYMTNWVIGHTNEFRAAITDRCVSNLISMFGNSDYPDRPNHYWQGNAWDDIESLWRHSPMKYLGNARTPTLIIHSEGDLRCNVEQSEQVFAVLQTHNVPVRFVRYPRSTSHGMSRSGPPDLRLHRLHQIVEWWKQWMK